MMVKCKLMYSMEWIIFLLSMGQFKITKNKSEGNNTEVGGAVSEYLTYDKEMVA